MNRQMGNWWLAASLFTVVLAVLLPVDAAEVRGCLLVDDDPGALRVLRLSDGSTNKVLNRIIEDVPRATAWDELRKAGDVVYRGGGLTATSRNLKLITEAGVSGLSNQSPSQIVALSDYVVPAPGGYVLLKTVAEQYALLGIAAKSPSGNSLAIYWVLNPGGDRPFGADDLKALRDKVNLHRNQQPAPVVTNVTYLPVSSPETGGEAYVFSFRSNHTATVSFRSRAASMEEMNITNRAVIASAGDVSYEFFNTGLLFVSSRRSGLLGNVRQEDYTNRDLSTSVKDKKSLWVDVRAGSVFVLKTLDQKYALMRIDSLDAKGVKFTWAYQPDGSALFPMGSLGKETEWPQPVQSPSDVDAALVSLCMKTGIMREEDLVLETRKLVAKGANVNLRASSGLCPLLEAASGGSLKMVQLLVDAGADIDQSAALVGAAGAGHFEICKYLLDKGANVEAVSVRNQTALQAAIRSGRSNERVIALLREKGAATASLHVAAETGDTNLVMKLIQGGADVNEIGKEDKTALCLAAEKGLTDMCTCLLKAGADPTTRLSSYGESALMAAVQGGHEDALRVMLQSPLVSLRHKSDAFYDAGSRKRLNLCRLILGTESNSLNIINASTNDLSTSFEWSSPEFIGLLQDVGVQLPLWSAARLGKLEVVRDLLKSGVDVNLLSPFKRTPLELAADGSHRDVVALLLTNGAAINVPNPSSGGYSPLHHAVAKGDLEMVKLLLSFKADVNIATRIGVETPLFVAVSKRNIPIIRALMDAGADPKLAPEYLKRVYGPKATTIRDMTEDKEIRALLDSPRSARPK